MILNDDFNLEEIKGYKLLKRWHGKYSGATVKGNQMEKLDAIFYSNEDHTITDGLLTPFDLPVYSMDDELDEIYYHADDAIKLMTQHLNFIQH